MSTIQSLTQNQPSNTRQLNLASALPSKICRIQSLQRFHSLKKLNLSNNCIQKIQSISHLTQLKVLNLQFNQITVLQNIQGLTNLEQLLLSYNSIESINPEIQRNKKLKVLNLSFNQIKAIDVLMPVFSLQKLVSLSLHGNPFINTLNYMVFVKLLMPDLLYLDEKDLNNTNLEGELYPQQQVAILRDTLNKLLEERNYLAQQLQNLTSVTSPTKINVKDYLKNYQSNDSQQNSVQNSYTKMATFSPIKRVHYFDTKKESFHQKKMNRQTNENQPSSMNVQNFAELKGSNQRQKMVQILQYWMKKIEDKMGKKKEQVGQLHEYYTNKLKQKQYQSLIKEKRQVSDQEEQSFLKVVQKNSSKQILQQIKQKQSQLNSYKRNIKAIKNLISEIHSLQPNQEMYKILMIKILFGDKSQQKDKENNKRQLNYRELKHFLLSEYGVLNALNDLNRLVFGSGEFSVEKVNQLKSWTGENSLLEIVKEAKSQGKQLKKEQKAFQKQKQSYLKRLQKQTTQLHDQWSQFKQTKKQFQFQKGKQFRYQHKLLEQRESEIENRYGQLQEVEKQKLIRLNQEKKNVQNQISIQEEKLQELQERYQRRYMELEEFQKQFNSFKQEKENMLQLQSQLKLIKKQLMQKENLIAETNQKLQSLSLNEEINAERLKFLERKCYQKSEQIKALDEDEKKLKDRIKRLSDQEKSKSHQLQTLKDKLLQLSQQEKSTTKSIQRHRSNLTLYQQKLKNLSDLQSHKKKSIQELQTRIQQQKTQHMHLNQKNIELEQILAQKQQHIHSYQVKISEHKKSLESYADMTRGVHQLIERQSELKKGILQLEIQNGNLIDLKNQLIREMRNDASFKNRPQWAM